VSGVTFIILQGGTRSSKTYSTLQLLYLIAEKHPLHISVVSETMPHLKKGALNDFKNILNADRIYDENRHNKTDSIYNCANGKIEFFSADSPDKVYGPARDILYLNEGDGIGWETFYQLNQRTSKMCIIDFNPRAEFWVQTELIPMLKPEEYVFIKSTYRDNDFLSEKIIKDIERRAAVDDNYRLVYAEGEMGRREGVVFGFTMCDVLPETTKRVIGLDFGFTNDPTAIVDLRLNDGKLWVNELVYDYGLTNPDIAARLRALNIPSNVPVVCDGAEPKSVEELKRLGVNAFSCTDKNINQGIQIIKQYPLMVSKSSTNVLKDLRNFSWKLDLNGKPLNVVVNLWKHSPDAIRYAAQWLCDKPITKSPRYTF
jgi:phage terminase large subunit